MSNSHCRGRPIQWQSPSKPTGSLSPSISIDAAIETKIETSSQQLSLGSVKARNDAEPWTTDLVRSRWDEVIGDEIRLVSVVVLTI